MPAVVMWSETTVAGMMQGMHRMVGTERFVLWMQAGGLESVDGDWKVISQAESFEAGFAELANYALTCGWGAWTLVSIDRETKRAVFRTQNNWECIYQQALGVRWGSGLTAGKFAGYCSRVFGTNCWATQTCYQAGEDAYDEFVVEPSSESPEERLDALLKADKRTRADLAAALERLEQENVERQRAEREARQRLETIEAMSAPTLQVWRGVLALPVFGSVSGSRADRIMDQLLADIQRTGSRFAILDLTGADVVDTNSADHLLRVVKGVGLLGATCVICGIQPAVAQTMVALEADLGGAVTKATLEDALGYCIAHS
ncbi:STAS domain-containing protein [Pseudenhygromyxa sp. WMMC2535]|nr:STAS domain-containing protein [Pseudenhygromyxa sp. WMMC2535]